MRKWLPQRPPARLLAPQLMFSVVIIVTGAFAFMARQPLAPAAPTQPEAPWFNPSKQFLPNGYIGFVIHPTATPTAEPTATPTPTWTPAPPTATPTPLPTATLTVGIPTATPTAPPQGNLEFNKGLVQSCAPNAGITYAEGTVYRHHQPANGVGVVWSWTPDGPWITEPITSGPHDGYPNWNPGFWSHIIGVSGPRAGDWYFWLVNGAGQRISVVVHLRTDGEAGPGKCQQAVIDFDTN